jgi:HPr kinase/phosphorylase
MEKLQASSVAIDGEAILLIGPSGSGKSDLCLRLMDRGGHLISDDFVELSEKGEQVYVSAPSAIEGLLEIRGIGIKRVAFVEGAPLKMVFYLKDEKDIERLPEPQETKICGISVPCFDINAMTASAPLKIVTVLSSSDEDFLRDPA